MASHLRNSINVAQDVLPRLVANRWVCYDGDKRVLADGATQAEVERKSVEYCRANSVRPRKVFVFQVGKEYVPSGSEQVMLGKSTRTFTPA